MCGTGLADGRAFFCLLDGSEAKSRAIIGFRRVSLFFCGVQRSFGYCFEGTNIEEIERMCGRKGWLRDWGVGKEELC